MLAKEFLALYVRVLRLHFVIVCLSESSLALDVSLLQIELFEP